MKFIKNNFKVIISFVVSVILASGITVYATSYLAKDITYKDNKTVADALNELYTIKNNYVLPNGTIKISTKSNQIDVSNYQYADTSELFTSEDIESNKRLTILDSNRTGFNIPENITTAYVIITKGTTNVPYTVTISGNIITTQELISNTNKTDVGMACYLSIYKLQLSGSSGTINLTASGGNAKSQAWNACLMY